MVTPLAKTTRAQRLKALEELPVYLEYEVANQTDSACVRLAVGIIAGIVREEIETLPAPEEPAVWIP